MRKTKAKKLKKVAEALWGPNGANKSQEEIKKLYRRLKKIK